MRITSACARQQAREHALQDACGLKANLTPNLQKLPFPALVGNTFLGLPWPRIVRSYAAENRGNDRRICSAAVFISRSRDEKFYRLSVEASEHGCERFSGAIAKQERLFFAAGPASEPYAWLFRQLSSECFERRRFQTFKVPFAGRSLCKYELCNPKCGRRGRFQKSMIDQHLTQCAPQNCKGRWIVDWFRMA